MILSLLLVCSLFTPDISKTSYPLRVTGRASAVEALVRIINHEVYPVAPVEAKLINAQTKEYGIRLIHKLDDAGIAKRENRFRCVLNYMLGDSSKIFRIRLVENDGAILIGNGRRGIIDIADAQKFDSNPKECNFNSFNILLHELYEQYQLQVINHLQPGKITSAQLKSAHKKAVQKESNFYSLTEVKTEAVIDDEYIHIEFMSRVDSTRTHYYAYHSYGNIERVERVCSH